MHTSKQPNNSSEVNTWSGFGNQRLISGRGSYRAEVRLDLNWLSLSLAAPRGAGVGARLAASERDANPADQTSKSIETALSSQTLRHGRDSTSSPE